MTIKIYNTITGKKDYFKPIKPKTATMYVCGVTPYDEVHLGHARAYVTFDVIRRHFINSGYKVTYIQNFTDIDDKIIKRAAEHNTSPKELADKYIESYFAQIDKLNVLRADEYPRVTGNIPQIIKFIEQLVKKDAAYAVDGDVFFSVRKCKEYGKLSKRNIEDLKSGARVEIDEHKNDPLDFALWKKSKPEEPQEVSFDSPWGKGRPGWHIECSVMSTNLLGKTIDIHGGGQDLIFPHHENEIAQTEAATGKTFVNYWIHNGFVTINKEKMSKSLGNFFTLKDIFKKYEPRVVRYFLLTQHYRSPIDFSDDKLNEARTALSGINEAYNKLEAELAQDSKKKAPVALKNNLEAVKNSFNEALDDDFNTEKAIASLHDLKGLILTNLFEQDKKFLKEAKNIFDNFLGELGITVRSAETLEKEIKDLIEKRNIARKEKRWKDSDAIRDRLLQLGIKLTDNPDGTTTFSYK